MFMLKEDFQMKLLEVLIKKKDNLHLEIYSNKLDIVLSDGTTVKAFAPVIVSASRSTDIPAFYADWFFNRLEAGYSI